MFRLGFWLAAAGAAAILFLALVSYTHKANAVPLQKETPEFYWCVQISPTVAACAQDIMDIPRSLRRYAFKVPTDVVEESRRRQRAEDEIDL